MSIARSAAAEALPTMLAGREIVVAPGCYDAFTALLIEEAGFHAAIIPARLPGTGETAAPQVKGRYHAQSDQADNPAQL